MQICSAHDGPLCSATGHNKKNSDEVPCCYLTQWLKKKKGAKASARQKWNEAFAWSWWWSIQQNCDISCNKQAGSPKNFHQQASLFLQYSSKLFQSTQDIISIRHCFSPGLWHYTQMANIFRLIQSEQKFNCGWRRGGRDRQKGWLCLPQTTDLEKRTWRHFTPKFWSPHIAYGQYGRRALWSQAVF